MVEITRLGSSKIYHATYSRAEMRRNQIQTLFSIAFFDAIAMRKIVNCSDRISIEKVVSENIDRRSDFFDSIIRRVILPKIEKGSFSAVFFDSIFRQHKKRSK